jgi:hypothetical protein
MLHQPQPHGPTLYRLILWLIIPCLASCEDWGFGTCDVNCEDEYDVCIDDHRPSSVCDAEETKCKKQCQDARDARNDNE